MLRIESYDVDPKTGKETFECDGTLTDYINANYEDDYIVGLLKNMKPGDVEDVGGGAMGFARLKCVED